MDEWDEIKVDVYVTGIHILKGLTKSLKLNPLALALEDTRKFWRPAVQVGDRVAWDFLRVESARPYMAVIEGSGRVWTCEAPEVVVEFFRGFESMKVVRPFEFTATLASRRPLVPR